MIGFLHVPKTGGTSLRRAFQSAGLNVWRPRGPRYMLTLPEVDLTGVDVVAGHVPFDVFSALPVDEWVTVLRDPVERWLSHSVGKNEVPTNLTCRLLSSFDSPDLEAARANLARFTHVGFTDRLSETFDRFGLQLRHDRESVRHPGPDWAEARKANDLDLALYNEARFP